MLLKQDVEEICIDNPYTISLESYPQSPLAIILSYANI